MNLSLRFDGPQESTDPVRLTGQLLRIVNAMKGGDWLTLRELAAATGDPEASISSQTRHLRKQRFGASTVERKHLGNGLNAYRLTLSAATRELLALPPTQPRLEVAT